MMEQTIYSIPATLVNKLLDLNKSRKTAVAGRHRKLNFIYIKHNFILRSANAKETELQNTHIVLFKSSLNVQQIDLLRKQIGLGNTLRKSYADATSIPYQGLMIDFSTKTNDLSRYSTDVNLIPD